MWGKAVAGEDSSDSPLPLPACLHHHTATKSRLADQGLPTESDLSQVMAHGPALYAAYGRFWGAVIMMLANTARRGPLGITAAVGIGATAL